MKQYDVKISRAALSDMEQIYSYIADLRITASARWYQRPSSGDRKSVV